MADLEAIVAGIDYGSRSSGNTVIVWRLPGGSLSFFRPEKGLDADAALLRILEDIRPATVGIDAPMSLPGRYLSLPGCSDYFYRHCDLELKAMSPMFLGGLTARAMRLGDQLREMDIFPLEVYPAQVAGRLSLIEHGYRKAAGRIPECADILMRRAEFKVDPAELKTWHHVDALLALMAAIRAHEGLAVRHGLEEEGLIFGW